MNLKPAHGLSAEVIHSLKSVFQKHQKIQKIIIYGSRAKGNYKSGSDIDLTLVAPDLNLKDLLALENEIEELMLPYKVDLSLYHQIENPDLISHIQRVGVEFGQSQYS